MRSLLKIFQLNIGHRPKYLLRNNTYRKCSSIDTSEEVKSALTVVKDIFKFKTVRATSLVVEVS